MGFFSPFWESLEYKNIVNTMREGVRSISITGPMGVGGIYVLEAIKTGVRRPALIITDGIKRAREVLRDIKAFDDTAILLSPKDMVFYTADVYSREIDSARLKVIESLIKGECNTIVAPIDALISKITPKNEILKHILKISVGDILPPKNATMSLIEMGYERADMVEGKGMFALRGGILDIFPMTFENPIRIEFWDDEVDSIRIIDSFSQRSIENITEFSIFPAQDTVFTEEISKKAINKIKEDYEVSKKSLKGEALNRLIEDITERLELLSLNTTMENPSSYINYFYDKPESIFDYLPEDTLIFMTDSIRTEESLKSVVTEFYESFKGRLENGKMLSSQSGLILNFDEVKSYLARFYSFYMSGIDNNMGDRSFSITYSPYSTKSGTKDFFEDIRAFKKKGYRTLIFSGGRSLGEKIANELLDYDIPTGYSDEPFKKDYLKGSVSVIKGSISEGFILPDFGISAISLIVSEKTNEKRKRRKERGAKIQSFTDLKIGDYVVHDNHGIGIYGGLEKINVDGVYKDYMKITYKDGGNLYVPVNQMDIIQKYIGAEGGSVRLNKLGGQDWTKAKNKAKAAVSIMADDLIRLYAKRQEARGFIYSKDNIWQKEFEEKFPYDETEDQLLAIEDVKRDMEEGRVMDRLICGDVGYGKTEVALRAAFKAVQDGKQVAYLVPTTILAQQHYKTFKERMEGYPITVKLLSRFNTQKEQKEILKNVKNGFTDIVIGTHRLLSKDVAFKNLGLIIVDEEQRFGVSHKEKLKRICEDVDVLTLTATPIPRTLHMSLSGIRDMSVLEEPPRERRPIQTFVMEAEDEFIREAIRRELSRNGQVFYLHNRVNSIREVAAKIGRLVPEANIAVGHGQMGEHELEDIMADFIEGRVDVLVCTTIIETGIDIPNANTIIINDADKMGLSQLYQLRGRVGRTNRSAYAYLLYKKDRALKEVSEKRLQTIKEFTEFGSGFKIAMRDLEIRGAGNLLGQEQHGHMNTIGYDMYCRLLNDAVREKRGEVIEESFETQLDLNINAYIPSLYIKNEELRLEMYKKISYISNKDDYFDAMEEIEDRYGSLPKTVYTLLEAALIRARAHRLDILSIVERNKNIVITFRDNAKIDTDRLTRLLVENKMYLYTQAIKPYITIKYDTKNNENQLTAIESFLEKLE